MAEIEQEIERRQHRIRENEARLTLLLNQLWSPDGAEDHEPLRQEELELRQKNLVLRREIAELKTKLPK